MKAILIFLIGMLLLGCASMKPHRSEFYQTNEGTKTVEAISSVSWITAPIGGSSRNARYLSVYPECVEKNTSQADFMECIKEIDIKEGRLKREAVEPPKLDEIRK